MLAFRMLKRQTLNTCSRQPLALWGAATDCATVQLLHALAYRKLIRRSQRPAVLLQNKPKEVCSTSVVFVQSWPIMAGFQFSRVVLPAPGAMVRASAPVALAS